jgi:hypothetical protein
MFKQTKISKYWLSGPGPVPTSNRYEKLEDDCEESQDTPLIKVIKPPPIFVDGVSNIQPLTKMLNETVSEEFELKVLRGEQVKIQPKTSQAYTTIVKELELRHTEFHTYKPKQDRSFRVVLRNMHPSTDVHELQTAIEELGHKVNNIWNIKQRATKKPLPIFYVELVPDSSNKQIYDTKYLLQCRITFEPPHPRREIPQCGNCQRYGHTKKFCHRKPRCVKCAGEHLTSECSRKVRSESVKCVLCGGNHPANYRGCNVYKQLQQTKFPRPRPTTMRNNNTSYAQAASNSDDKKQTSTNTSSNNNNNSNVDLLDLLKQLMVQLTTMSNILTQMITSLQLSPSIVLK